MTARKNTAQLPRTRQKIQATLLIKKLQDHILGKSYMTQSQEAAALSLIQKVVPDKRAVRLDAQVDHDITIRWLE